MTTEVKAVSVSVSSLATAATSSLPFPVKKIGILGSGVVGRFLATGLAKKGYHVHIATRNPLTIINGTATESDLSKWYKSISLLPTSGSGNGSITLSTFNDTASFGELLILATSYAGIRDAIILAGIDNFAGKTVIDLVGPVAFIAGQPELTPNYSISIGEQVQSWLPNAHIVKALNHIGHVHMIDPNFGVVGPDTFIAGNNSDAKAQTIAFLGTIGWTKDHIIDFGLMGQSRLLEPLSVMYVRFAFASGRTLNHAFALLRK